MTEYERQPVASPALIEALMTQALADTARAYWNINQTGWGPWLKDYEDLDVEDYNDIERYFPMALGDITVTHVKQFSGYGGHPLGTLLKFEFRGFWVTSWFNTKRLYYEADLSRDVTPHELVNWFECLEEHIRWLDKAHWDSLRAKATG